MKFTVLGCGNSTGVPFIHCSCPVCRSRNPKNKRLRSSLWIEARGKSILIDTTPDLRQQAIRAKIRRLDAVLYTHNHADHTHGIDELRSYNFIQREPIPVYANPSTAAQLRQSFAYAFGAGKYGGGGTPVLHLHEFDPAVESLDIGGVKVVPVPYLHGKAPGLGYRIGNVGYVTDISALTPVARQRLEGLEVLFLDCVRLEPHDTHLNLDQALEVASQLRAKKTFLTHLGHDFEYVKYNKRLPKGIQLAYDGLKITTS